MHNNFITGCTSVGNTPSCTSYATTNLVSDYVELINPFTLSNGLNSGDTLQISIKNVRMPSSLKPRSTFSIYTADGDGNLIDQCSGLTLTLSNMATFTTSSPSYVSLTGDSGMGQKGTYQFYMQVQTNVH